MEEEMVEYKLVGEDQELQVLEEVEEVEANHFTVLEQILSQLLMEALVDPVELNLIFFNLFV